MKEKLNEIKISLIIIVIGVIFLGGCFFSGKKTVSFKTNGGTIIQDVSVKKGNSIKEPEAPTKDGYTFDGWYLDGKKYNFKKGVNGDITLVAKWTKDEVEETTTTTETTTTKKNKTTKKATTTKKVSSTKKTTKKVTTTKPIVTTSTTAKTTTTSTTTSTTTTTTTPKRLLDNLAIAFSITDKELQFIYGTESLLFNDVITELTDEEVNLFLESDKTKWSVFNESGELLVIKEATLSYTLIADPNYERNIYSVNGYDKNDNPFHYVFVHDNEEGVYYMQKPLVSLGSGENSLDTVYYSDLETAIKCVDETNNYITLLGNNKVKDTLVVKDYITIDSTSNKYSITTNMDKPLFKLTDDLNDDTKTIKLINANISCKKFVSLEDNVKLNNDQLDITGKITYYATTGYKFNPDNKINMDNLADDLFIGELK